LNAVAARPLNLTLSHSQWEFKCFFAKSAESGSGILAATLMRYLYTLLALCVVAIMAAVGALLWRLRWHMGRPHTPPPNPALEPQPEQEPEPVEKA
jgi:hypothetical protein